MTPDQRDAHAQRMLDHLGKQQMNDGLLRETRETLELAREAIVAKIAASVWWISVSEEWPDADATVLVAREGNDIGEPVWLGYTDGKTWFDACTGAEFAGRVTHWAQMPMGPNP